MMKRKDSTIFDVMDTLSITMAYTLILATIVRSSLMNPFIKGLSLLFTSSQTQKANLKSD